MLRRTDEPQPRRRLNRPPVINHFRQHLFASSETVDDAAGSPARGGWRQGLVMPTVSVSKGAKPGIAKPPGSSHDDSGFMAWHVVSHSGNGKWFLGILRCVFCTCTRRSIGNISTFSAIHGPFATTAYCSVHLSPRDQPVCASHNVPVVLVSPNTSVDCRSVHVVDGGSCCPRFLSHHLLPQRGFSHQPALALAWCVRLGRP
jgi:hypothetical protein